MQKLYLLCLCGLLHSFPTWSQTCGCERVEQEGRGFGDTYTTKDAQDVIDSFANLFQHKPEIEASPYVCKNGRPASARFCFKRKEYIFFDVQTFTALKSAARQSDRFILAHEVAHHVLGHTTEAYYQTRSTQAAASFPRQAYGIRISDSHLTELEADALGLWLSLKRGLQPTDIQKVFAALRRISYLNPDESKTHPSFRLREDLLNGQLARYGKQASKIDKHYPLVHRSFANTDSANTASTQWFEQDIYNAYVSALLVDRPGASEIDTLTVVERAQRDTLIRQARFSVEPTAGWQTGRPVLTRNGAAVASTAAQGYWVGLRLGFTPWFRRHRLEVDLLAGPSTFTTQTKAGDQIRPVEQFNTTYLYVRPHYAWSWLARKTKQGYRTSGWIFTAGASVAWPIAFQYVYGSVNPYQSPKQRPSWAPVAGLRYGKSHWRNREGHWRIGLQYLRQPLRFRASPPDPIRAVVHTLSLDLSFRFW